MAFHRWNKKKADENRCPKNTIFGMWNPEIGNRCTRNCIFILYLSVIPPRHPEVTGAQLHPVRKMEPDLNGYNVENRTVLRFQFSCTDYKSVSPNISLGNNVCDFLKKVIFQKEPTYRVAGLELWIAVARNTSLSHWSGDCNVSQGLI
jgi:hypothetical protein